MNTPLYWIEDITTDGKLAISPRPRGSDWLEDEIHYLKSNRVDIVVCALMPSEIIQLELTDEEQLCHKHNISYLSYPIPDRETPQSMREFYDFTQKLSFELTQGKNILVHCRQGIGRSSLIAASLLRHIEKKSASEIFQMITLQRGINVPDTKEQSQWLQKWIELSFEKSSIENLFS